MASVLTALKPAMSEASGSTRFDAAPLTTDQQSKFVQDNMRRVFLLIYRIVNNVADAQDLTQEAFIKGLQRQDQLKDLEKAAHWLSRIASNTAIDFLRRAGRVSFSELEELPEPVLRSTLDNPEQLVLRSEHRYALEASLSVLTERERTALLLRDVEDMPAEEVAAHLNCSKATVRSHIAKALVSWRPVAVAAGMLVLLAGAWWLNLPWRGAAPRLTSAEDRSPMVQVNDAGIELRANGGTMGVSGAGPGRPVAVSASMQGTARARYVDDDTAQVTITSVYVQ